MPQLIAGLAVAGALAVALLTLVSEWTNYNNPSLFIVFNTGLGVFGGMIAFLFIGHVRQTDSARGARVVIGISTFAFGNLIFGGLIPALASPGDSLAIWGAALAHVIGAGFLVAAALAGAKRTAARVLGVELPAALIALLAGSVVAGAFGADQTLTATGVPMLSGDTNVAIATTHVVVGLMLAVAAVAFLRLDRQGGGKGFEVWIAAGCLLSAYARVGSISALASTERLWSGDLLRVSAYACWLVAAARETASYWDAAVRLALLEDRRRIAEELHDGVAQDLAFILMQSRLAQRLSDEPHLPTVVTAAERALGQTREAIRALSSMRAGGEDDSASARTGAE